MADPTIGPSVIPTPVIRQPGAAALPAAPAAAPAKPVASPTARLPGNTAALAGGTGRASLTLPGAAPAAGTAPLLASGANGAPVTSLQTALNGNGAKLTVDGKFGTATAAAVTSFQTQNGLKVDGKAGPETSAALDAKTQMTAAAALVAQKASPDPATEAKRQADIKTALDKAQGDLGSFRPESAAAKTNFQNQINQLRAQAAPAAGLPVAPPLPAAAAPSAAVAADLQSAKNDWTSSGAFEDTRKALGESQSPADFKAVADTARQIPATAEHADTIQAIGTATTPAVRNALRDAYANAGDPANVATKLQAAMQTPNQSPADHAAVLATVNKLNQEGLTPLAAKDVNTAYAAANAPKPAPAAPAAAGPVSATPTANVAADLKSANGDWTSSGRFNDVAKALGESNTPADFAAVAATASAYSNTAEHAATIQAIGSATSPTVRNALRDAYADAGNTQKVAASLQTALNAPNQSPQDRAAVVATIKKLNQEGLTPLTLKDVKTAYGI